MANYTRHTNMDDLTPREQDVVGRLAVGADLRLIAADLGISYASARIYASHAYEKLGVSGARDLRAGASEDVVDWW
jgi:DNA-binding CsgD family transcriptional regulator